MSFEARYSGACAFVDCTTGIIEPGDTVEYDSDDELMHSSCSARARRQNTAPYCNSCHTYHRGEC